MKKDWINVNYTFICKIRKIQSQSKQFAWNRGPQDQPIWMHKHVLQQQSILAVSANNIFLCSGISKMRTTDKSTTPCSPTTVSSCKVPQRASSKLPVKGIPTSPSFSSSTISENNSIAVNKGACKRESYIHY